MGDDAVGVVVARRLAREHPGLPAEVVEGGMAGMGLVRHFLDSAALVVIDAIDAGAEPGAVFRFDPDEAGVTQLRSNNIHGMGLPHLLTNARLLGAWPRVVVYAVQVADVRPSERLSPAVESALPDLLRMVAEEAESLAAEACGVASRAKGPAAVAQEPA
jgi:hydrogenase maturation protease